MATPTPIPSTTPTLTHNPQTGTLSLSPQPVPLPTPNTQEHLLQIRAVALTNGELAWPEPRAATPIPVPGYEIAGTVVLAPAGSAFRPGDAVVARTAFERPGNARAYGVALTSELGRMPAGLRWDEAATVPLSALTAWQALFVHGGLAAPAAAGGGRGGSNVGKRVLVTAAAGGVGIYIVQLAKLTGAYVVGTCGPDNVEFVRSLGADEVLDYRQTDVRSWVGSDESRKFDLVLDGVGGSTLEEVWTVAKDGGIVISIVLPAELKKPAEGVGRGVRTTWFIVDADGEQLNRITELIEEGKLKAAVDSTFNLEEYEEAFKKVKSGHVRGKVVLKIEN